MARPYQPTGIEAHPVPHDMKMLAASLDVLDNDPLVTPAPVSVFVFKPLTYREDLPIRKPLVLHWIDTDMVQGLAGAGG